MIGLALAQKYAIKAIFTSVGSPSSSFAWTDSAALIAGKKM